MIQVRLIDADALGNRMYHESFEKDSDLQKWDSGCWIRYKLFEQVLRAAPTIDLTHPTSSNTNVPDTNVGDLINREYMKSLGATCIASRSKDGNMFPIVSIDELPSVQPEVIRCKDCKWWDKQEMSLQGRCSLLQMYPTGEWYCGNAKLRGDSDD